MTTHRTTPIIPEPEPGDLATSNSAEAKERVIAARKRLAENPAAVAAGERVRAEIDAIVDRRVQTLAALRKARELTQVQLAHELSISQGDVSKLEQRTNILLSTLARFVEATGGHLRILADYGDDTVEVELGQTVAAGNPRL